MARLVTIFTGQWADLPFEQMCRTVSEIGYEGVEIACWGDHMDVQKAATDPAYVAEKKAILKKYNLQCYALGNHLGGQCVGDAFGDPRLAGFAPKQLKGDDKAIRAWGIEQMKYTAIAAKNMGCSVVTGFMGSPIWKYFYSFPSNSEELIEAGYQEIYDLWTPILDVFDEQGVKFALEVHPSEIAYDYYSTERLLKKFNNRPALGLNFDPSHLQWQGVDPALFFRDFASKIYHVHIKDCYVKLDGRSGILGSHIAFGDLRRGWNFVSPGHGDVNFEFIIREANAANYRGPLSVEWEDNGMERIFGATEALALVRRIDFDSSNIDFDGAMEN
ncbi:sugar phosphate isomerase/epimerase family protein [Sphaerochaeta sp. PS]|uniref:sugar phosphate isomerase/epimerase family protein n=1 Tax=Sphaerochaeta sp. PS TaxID=3076336 RepID=UPI0028A2E4BC|nr:sugar phosphate isomerase/epimerase family protein [Sphaerochaeta sp. PS]MDT4763218.1 sugar phosphate isomerase/epimerase family protein [Sphaerochaeta sp. PS]